jgi:hypothetical protein
VEDVYYTSMCTVIYTSNYGNYYAMISIPDKQMYKSSWWYIIVNRPEKSDSKKFGKANSERGDRILNRLKDIWDISNQFETLLQQGADLVGNPKELSSAQKVKQNHC